MSNGYKILVATWKSSRDLRSLDIIHHSTQRMELAGLKGHIKAQEAKLE